MFIPDPDFYRFQITDLGSRISDPGSGSATLNFFYVLILFAGWNNHLVGCDAWRSVGKGDASGPNKWRFSGQVTRLGVLGAFGWGNCFTRIGQHYWW